MRTRSLGLVLASAIAGTSLLGLTADRVLAVQPTCFDLTPTIIATGGVTNGTSGPDVILGSGGDDTINGKGGNDYICDFEGNNVIHGNTGNDHIDAVGLLYGDAGDDYILSGITLDVQGQGQVPVTTNVYGGTGADFINVEIVDVADGGAGDDTILVFGATRVNGGSGNDELEVDKANTADAGSGNDKVIASATQLVDCGSGTDEYDLADVQTVRRCESEIESI